VFTKIAFAKGPFHPPPHLFSSTRRHARSLSRSVFAKFQIQGDVDLRESVKSGHFTLFLLFFFSGTCDTVRVLVTASSSAHEFAIEVFLDEAQA